MKRPPLSNQGGTERLGLSTALIDLVRLLGRQAAREVTESLSEVESRDGFQQEEEAIKNV
jgi:hypothetical protein